MKLSIEELGDVLANAKTSLEQYLALELIELKGKRVPVAYTGSGSLAAIKGGREGYIWGEPGEAHPIELYTTPQPAHTEQNGWIKCSDRMPECRGEIDHKTVLISEGRNCVVAFYNKRDRKFLDQPFGFSIGGGVTHWMPLPAAPKPESE
ncbi:DUF551 domain-containing protein [Rahnella victoriana]|nr:DUF551 domain-containing protein [Rahnella victoriana]